MPMTTSPGQAACVCAMLKNTAPLQSVGGTFSARVPRSSAEVRGLVIHDIKEKAAQRAGR